MTALIKMPKIRTSKSKPPPFGFEDIEPQLLEFDIKMREAESCTSVSREAMWPIFHLHHQRSRYIYDLYYNRDAISKELYDYLLDQNYADRNLIAKWKKPGYENLCCLKCIQPKESNFQTLCICRVPKKDMDGTKIFCCLSCGCKGCG